MLLTPRINRTWRSSRRSRNNLAVLDNALHQVHTPVVNEVVVARRGQEKALGVNRGCNIIV
jgi:hypothetical protein